MPTDNPRTQDPTDNDYPETLRITIATAEEAFDEAVDSAAVAEDGRQTAAVVSFETAAGVRRLLTDRRLELLQSLMDESAESITSLANRVERSYSIVHDDIDVLKTAGIVKFRNNGKSKQPFIPYETIEFDVTVRASVSERDAEASA